MENGIEIHSCSKAAKEEVKATLLAHVYSLLTRHIVFFLGCAVVTGLGYPSRTAIAMLTELYDETDKKFGDQLMSAKENSLNKRSKTIMTNTCKKYEDSANVDKAQAVLGKVEGVKAQMQDNIAGMLKNTEKAESLAEQSDQLNEQAAVFKKNSTDLKKQMKCKNMKMTILLTGLVIGILLVILVPLIIKAKNNKST